MADKCLKCAGIERLHIALRDVMKDYRAFNRGFNRRNGWRADPDGRKWNDLKMRFMCAVVGNSVFLGREIACYCKKNLC